MLIEDNLLIKVLIKHPILLQSIEFNLPQVKKVSDDSPSYKK
jgi:hypothetical protein